MNSLGVNSHEGFYIEHPSTIPLGIFHGRFLKTFSHLPLQGKCVEVIKRVAIVVISPFAYLALGAIAVAGYWYTKRVEIVSAPQVQGVEKVSDRFSEEVEHKALSLPIYARFDGFLQLIEREYRAGRFENASLALTSAAEIAKKQQCIDDLIKFIKKLAEVFEVVSPKAVTFAERVLNTNLKVEYKPGKMIPFQSCVSLMGLVECYYLFNNEKKLKEIIDLLVKYADIYDQKGNSRDYVGVYDMLAQFYVENGQVQKALEIINQVIMPAIREPYSGIDVKPSVEFCMHLANLLWDHDPNNETVNALIQLSEEVITRWEKEIGPRFDNQREQVAILKEKQQVSLAAIA